MSRLNKKKLNDTELVPVLDFFVRLQSKIRCCKRNTQIAAYLKSFSTLSHEKLNFLKSKQSLQVKSPQEDFELDPSGIFMWFMMKKRKMRDLIPDIEFLKYREICSEMISVLGACPEAHFGIGKMFAHEVSFDLALQHIRISLSENKNDITYNLWNAILTVFRVNSKKRALQAKKICNSKK